MTSLRKDYAYQRVRPKAHTVAQSLLTLFQLLLQAKILFFAKQSHLIPGAKPGCVDAPNGLRRRGRLRSIRIAYCCRIGLPVRDPGRGRQRVVISGDRRRRTVDLFDTCVAGLDLEATRLPNEMRMISIRPAVAVATV
jgi:hypothetical protein